MGKQRIAEERAHWRPLMDDDLRRFAHIPGQPSEQESRQADEIETGSPA